MAGPGRKINFDRASEFIFSQENMMIKGLVKTTEVLGAVGLEKLAKDLVALSKIAVYVGIPEDRGAREKDSINNAQLLYIHTNGSPLRNIPKRPVIEPALEAEDNQVRIEEPLKLAAQACLEGKMTEVKNQLNRAGMAGLMAAKMWFFDSRNGWPPDTARTVRRKLAKMKEGPEKQEAYKSLRTTYVQRTITAMYPRGEISRTFTRQEITGSYLWDGDTVNVNTPLIDTGAMRDSITYLVFDGKNLEEGGEGA